MDLYKNHHLDELFDLVRHTKTQVPFEETKHELLQAIKSADITQPSKRFGNPSLWLVVATTGLLALAAGGYLLQDTPPTVLQENLPPAVAPVLADSAQKQSAQEPIVPESVKEDVQTHPIVAPLQVEPQEVVVFEEEEPMPSIVLQQTAKPPLEATISAPKPLDSVYRFPSLTEKEQAQYQKQKDKMLKQVFKWDKHQYAAIPAGSVELDSQKVSVGALYMQTTEVSNQQYRTFLFDLLKQGRKEDFLVARPDQKVWTKDYYPNSNQPMVDHYFSHEAYNNYPVVGISRAGAELYCQWLTTEVQKAYGKRMKGTFKGMRLPTEAEWIHAAQSGKSYYVYPWGGPYTRNKKGRYLANFRPLEDSYEADGMLYTNAVDGYFPNDYGLYCMSGNVAEMVYYSQQNNVPGTKGGSWTSPAYEIKIKGSDRFKGVTKPSVDIGFRVVGVYYQMPLLKSQLPQLPKELTK